MSRSTEHAVSVRAPRDVETFVIDHAFRLAHRGVGDFTHTLRAGLYKFKFRRGLAVEERLIEIGETGPTEIEAPDLRSRSAVPLRSSRGAGDRHFAAAHQLSHQTHVKIGAGSRMFVFSRRSPEERATGCDVAGGLALHHLDGSLAVDLEQTAVRDDPGGIPYAACSIELDPGPYRLRLSLCDEPLEQIVFASPGWQTQVFLMPESGREEHHAPPPPLASASILMCRGGFEPDDEMLRLADSARIALKQKHGTMPRELLTTLLDDKFENPMLGIYGAHALLAQEGDDSTFQLVVSILEGRLVPGHPDVAALRIAAGEKGVEIHWPPMLRASWNLILSASFDGRTVVQPGSLACRIPAVLLEGTPWLIWPPSALLAPDTAMPRDVSAELSELEDRIAALAESSTAAEGIQLSATEEELFSYLSRRSRLRKRSKKSENILKALDDRSIAAAFRTTVENVQTTISGLASKLRTPAPAKVEAAPQINLAAEADS